MSRFDALIVDDEPLARDKIKQHLKSHTDIVVAGECGDGRSAVDAIRKLKPDLVFLDVQMPGGDGFEVLEALEGEVVPAIVFVTAFDKYAVRAFEVHALDYLLKPFDRERFDDAIGRVISRLADRDAAGAEQRLVALMEEIKSGASVERYADRLVIRTRGRVIFLSTAEIDWVEAAANYVRFHSGKNVHLMRDTMTNVEAKLDPEQFVRIHRSFIVRIDSIREMEPWSHGEYTLVLKDGTQLTSSRGYRDRVATLLGRKGRQ